MGEIIIDAKCETNVKGVFAAGDCTTVPYKQIIIAAGRGKSVAERFRLPDPHENRITSQTIDLHNKEATQGSLFFSLSSFLPDDHYRDMGMADHARGIGAEQVGTDGGIA